MTAIRKMSLAIIILFAACSRDKEMHVESTNFSISAVAYADDIRSAAATSAVVVVRARLTIRNAEENIAYADLRCFSLEIDGRRDSGLYIDRVAHVLPDKFMAKNGSIEADVYWTFPGVNSAVELDINGVTRVYLNQPESQCIFKMK